MSNKNKAIEMLAVYHKEYINMAKSIAGNHHDVKNYAEDYVQEAYLRLSRYENLYDKVIKAEKVSKGYMFFVLRSIIINDIKKKRNLNYNFIGDQYDFEEKYMLADKETDPIDQAMIDLEDKMLCVLKDSAQWFDYELFKKYLGSGKSFKTISKESGIGIRTIYLSIKRAKLIIAEELFEDYQDYINGDFNLI